MISTVDVNEKFKSENVSVYPNPASSELYISIAGIENEICYSFLDMTGKEIRKDFFYGNSEKIYLNDLAAGIYFLNIYSDEKFFSRKIIVQ
jgi:hypothetical protein